MKVDNYEIIYGFVNFFTGQVIHFTEINRQLDKNWSDPVSVVTVIDDDGGGCDSDDGCGASCIDRCGYNESKGDFILKMTTMLTRM